MDERTGTPQAHAAAPAGLAIWRRFRERVAGARSWRRWGLAALLGVLASAALPPLNWVVLLLPALVGFVWLVDGARSRRGALAVGWWFGFGHFAASFYWISHAFLVDAERFAWMIPFAVGGLATGFAVFIAIPAVALYWARGAGIGRILLFAAAWTASEWIRSWFLTGFPWQLVGTAWVFSDIMIQPAAVVSVYGLGLITVLGAAMPAVLGDRPRPPRRAVLATSVAVALLVLSGLGGALRLASATDATVPGVQLRLVQPNIPQALKWRRDLRERHVLQQIELSLDGAQGGSGSPPVTHVIWAETSVPFTLDGDERLLEVVSRAAPAGGMAIVGAPRATPRGEEPYQVWNSLHAVDPGGQVIASYDKAHLVPFGEYIPFREVIDIPKVTAGRTDFSPGPGRASLGLPGLPPVSPLICYEVIFPGRVVDRDRRPGWLLNLTNDAWFGHSAGPHQHLAAARMRAVEEGLPLVRVANTGISAVFDAYGRTIARLELGETGVIDSPLPVAIERRTPYGRYGNGLVLVIVLMVAVGGALPLLAGTAKRQQG